MTKDAWKCDGNDVRRCFDSFTPSTIQAARTVLGSEITGTQGYRKQQQFDKLLASVQNHLYSLDCIVEDMTASASAEPSAFICIVEDMTASAARLKQ
eukprot:5206-Heterococcus_DN1.PRE.1